MTAYDFHRLKQCLAQSAQGIQGGSSSASLPSWNMICATTPCAIPRGQDTGRTGERDSWWGAQQATGEHLLFNLRADLGYWAPIWGTKVWVIWRQALTWPVNVPR